jgi:hypothetical protein
LKARRGEIFKSGRRKDRGEWPACNGGESEATGKRKIEEAVYNLLQAEGDGAWSEGDTMEKARSGSFEVRDAATQKLLCLFGSGRSSPNIMVQYVVTSVSYLKLWCVVLDCIHIQKQISLLNLFKSMSLLLSRFPRKLQVLNPKKQNAPGST